MKRELKAPRCKGLPSSSLAYRKAYPDEKGTERNDVVDRSVINGPSQGVSR